MAVTELRFDGAGGHPTRGWLARPEDGKSNGRGVVVIHELLGLIDNIKPILERFTSEGYVAFAPDLFDKPEPTLFCVAKTMTAMQLGRGAAMADLDAAVELVRNQDGVDPERICAVGFCMGGGFAMLLALDKRVRAVAPYYGVCPINYLQNIKNTAPVVASYGSRDLVVGNQGKRLEKALKKCGATYDYKEYENAGHSFMTVTPKGPVTRFGPVSPLRAEYVEEAAEDSWRRMLGFFSEHV